jgi:hypothetical protein
MSSFGANGFSVKPFLWLWYNRFFSTARFGYYDQTSAFDKISEYFHIIKLLQPEIQEIVQIHK